MQKGIAMKSSKTVSGIVISALLTIALVGSFTSSATGAQESYKTAAITSALSAKGEPGCQKFLWVWDTDCSGRDLYRQVYMYQSDYQVIDGYLAVYWTLSNPDFYSTQWKKDATNNANRLNETISYISPSNFRCYKRGLLAQIQKQAGDNRMISGAKFYLETIQQIPSVSRIRNLYDGAAWVIKFLSKQAKTDSSKKSFLDGLKNLGQMLSVDNALASVTGCITTYN
jgi:hypothetical protein